MFNKLFNNPNKHLTQELNNLAARLPETRWLALVNGNGLIRASFPDPLSDPDRITAMTAAAGSLGERILKELKSGELRYQLLGGTTGTILTLVLSPDYLLTLNLRPITSVDALFAALRAESTPLWQAINLPQPAHWLEGA
jgi:predicted regulator of Ras-like GTPase activity (Roadblock/LC7/MglB family)